MRMPKVQMVFTIISQAKGQIKKFTRFVLAILSSLYSPLSDMVCGDFLFCSVKEKLIVRYKKWANSYKP